MTDKEKIRAKIEKLLKEWRGRTSAEAKYRCEAYRELLDITLHEEPASEDLGEAVIDIRREILEMYGKFNANYPCGFSAFDKMAHHFVAWQKRRMNKRLKLDEVYKKGVEYGFRKGRKSLKKKDLWHDAQGDDLPEVDREVVAFQGRKVVIAHRPDPKGWDGMSFITGEVEHYTPTTYGKGGWNMDGITYWLDAPLPEGIE